MNPQEFCVRVDPINPGQFFACCGLLEIADRIYGGAEGWFEEGKFLISTSGSLEGVLNALVEHMPDALTQLDNGLGVAPIIAPLKLRFDDSSDRLVLDAWSKTIRKDNEVMVIANHPWQFWSGQQTPQQIWYALSAALKNQMKNKVALDSENLFEEREFLSGRFGFDPMAACSAIEMGFSPNEQGIKVASSPAVELLAAVGIQRFRPDVESGNKTFIYSTWGYPLYPEVAAAFASGRLTSAGCVRFRGCVLQRGQYSSLGFSILLRK
jgi:CRISPR-associated protein Csx14